MRRPVRERPRCGCERRTWCSSENCGCLCRHLTDSVSVKRPSTHFSAGTGEHGPLPRDAQCQRGVEGRRGHRQAEERDRQEELGREVVHAEMRVEGADEAEDETGRGSRSYQRHAGETERQPESARGLQAPMGKTSRLSGTSARASAGPRVRMIGSRRVMAARPENVLAAMVTRAMAA